MSELPKKLQFADIVVERFFSKVKYSDDCWLWQGSLRGKGYGALTINSKRYSAHRWSYEYFIGPIQPGNVICHHCDVPNCVNPFHLFQGTYRDNCLDMFNKGRDATKYGVEHRLGGRTHCSRGHEYTPETMRVNKKGHRFCLICERIHNKNYRERNREKERIRNREKYHRLYSPTVTKAD